MKTALLFGGRFAAVSGLGLWLMIVGYALITGATSDEWLGFGLFVIVFALIAGIWTAFSRERKASKETDQLRAELAQLRASQAPQLSAAPQGN